MITYRGLYIPLILGVSILSGCNVLDFSNPAANVAETPTTPTTSAAATFDDATFDNATWE